MPDDKLVGAARRKAKTAKMYRGKYAGPDEYKGVIPEELKDKYKGKYFGKEKYEGANRPANLKPIKLPFPKPKKVSKRKKIYPGWTDANGVRHAGNEPGKKYAL